MDARIRLARDADSENVAQLIRDVFAEYAGIVFDLEELPELRAIASHFARKGGRFWVLEELGEVLGCIGLSRGATSHEMCELHKLYVKKGARRRGIGRALCDVVEREAATRAKQIELWTDVKFLDAHAFYERRGYVRSAQTRALGDLSDTHEYHYVKQLR